MQIKLLSIFALLLLIQACKLPGRQAPSNNYDMDFKWTLDSIQTSGPEKSFVSMELTNRVGVSLDNKNWSIHYNHLCGGVDQASVPKEISVEHVTGDYYIISPTESWPNLNSGKSIRLNFAYNGILSKKSEEPKGVFIVINEDARPLNFLASGINEEVLNALNLPTNDKRFDKNSRLTLVDLGSILPIVPSPEKITRTQGIMRLAVPIKIYYQESDATEAKAFMTRMTQAKIAVSTSKSVDEAQVIIEKKGGAKEIHPESYLLSIDSNKIRIEASDAPGLFYGIQSLSQLIIHASLTQKHIEIEQMEIQDTPRFAYRGMHLDVSRNFHSKEKVFEILDLMSLYKLNKFQFHLTDDEGWRIEIPGLPELTTVGSRRGYTRDENDFLFPAYGSGPNPDKSYGSGFYTREEYIDILKYAAARHIEVIPEIDIPGHSRAAIKAMYSRYRNFLAEGHSEAANEYLLHDLNDESVYKSAQQYDDNVMNLCLPGSYKFMTKVIDEMVKMHNEAGAPLKVLHTGGDEVPFGVWQKSPKCLEYVVNNPEIGGVDNLHAHFLRWLKELLNQYQITTAGWEEILLVHGEAGHNSIEINPEFVQDQMRAYVWNATMGGGREDMAYKLANMGYPVVMCNSSAFYFDMADDRDPDNIGLSWSGYADTERAFSVEPYDVFIRETLTSWGTELSPEFFQSRIKLSPEGKEKFLGIQAQLWSETTGSAADMDKLVYPKLLGFSERAWSTKPIWTELTEPQDLESSYQREWNIFANRLGQSALKILDLCFEDVQYHIPKPAIRKIGNELHANSAYPGLTIRYSQNGKDPDMKSKVYTSPIKDEGKEYRFATFTSNGRKGSTVNFK